MKLFLHILFILLGVTTVVAQDRLYPLESYPVSNTHPRKLSTRSSDTLYTVSNFDKLNLPFFDDFSSIKAVPQYLNRSLANFAGDFFYTGKCMNTFGYRSNPKSWKRTQTYRYFWNSTTSSIDSTPTNPIDIKLFLDSPVCHTHSSTNTWYPAYCRPRYSSSGTILDSFCFEDTIISGAFVEQYFFKRELWIDRYAYFNRHYAVKPPSMGVATLDGLNEKGRPYIPDIFDAYGRADKLTSSYINLAPFNDNDSVYLSFLYQPQGFGDFPDQQDSLLVEFKDDNSEWHPVWRAKGLRSEAKIDTLGFQWAIIKMPRVDFLGDPNYYHDSFQFRFVNYATLTGNNDHWHIDFVELDTARRSTDTILRDANFVYELPSLLKEYTQLPSKQYRGNMDLQDTVLAYNRNYTVGSILSTYNINCVNETNASVLYSSTGIPYSTNPLVEFPLLVKNNFNIPSSIPDSTAIKASAYLDASDAILHNDTASITHLFHKEMAYDDGTAEMAYGIEGFGTKKVAYKFKIPVQDTLAAIKIMFSNIHLDVRNLIFNLNIWKSIAVDTGSREVLLATLSNKKPWYSDSLNIFRTYYLDTPLIVKDSIYVGWTQADERNLQIGYDRNSTLGLKHTYIFVNNVWSPSNVVAKGSPMIRLILDGRYQGASAAVYDYKRIQAPKIEIYPNPAANELQVRTQEMRSPELALWSFDGRLRFQTKLHKHIEENTINIQEIPEGIYILTISDEGQPMHSERLRIIR